MMRIDGQLRAESEVGTADTESRGERGRIACPWCEVANCDHTEQMSRKKLEYEQVKQCTIQYDTCAAVPSPKAANELRQHRILEHLGI